MSRRRQATQYLVLVGANGAGVLVNFALMLVLTRIMAKGDFGSYRYVVTFFNTAAIIAQLGIPYAASVVLTRADEQAETRRTITATALVMLAVSVTVSALLAFVWAVAGVVGLSIDPALVAASPFVFAPILQYAYIEMLKGAGRIGAIAAQTLMGYLLLFVLVLLARQVGWTPLAFHQILALHVASYSVVHVVALMRFWALPQWRSSGVLARLRLAVREVGVHVYLGSLFGIASANLLALLLGVVVGMAQYGEFGLAMSMATPMQMVPAVMGTVLFRENARAQRLGSRATRVTLSITAAALAGYVLLLSVFFGQLFPPSYGQARGYAIALAAGYACFGLGDYYNRFIGAHGHGRLIKRAALAAGVVNVVVGLSLVWRFGIAGVVAGSIAAGAAYLGLMVRYYRQVVSGAVALPAADLGVPQGAAGGAATTDRQREEGAP